MDLVEKYYDYSAQNLEYLQKKFEKLQMKKKSEIGQEEPAQVPENTSEMIAEEEGEWEDCESENEEIKEEKEKKDVEASEPILKEEDNEIYVLVKGYWRPLKDKLLTNKFQKSMIDSNENGELVLPNGDIIGHKKYARYYKQNMSDIMKKKNELIKAITNREMNRFVNASAENTKLAPNKYKNLLQTLER